MIGGSGSVAKRADSSGADMRCLTPAFAAGLERSGKPVRQHALVMFYHSSDSSKSLSGRRPLTNSSKELAKNVIL